MLSQIRNIDFSELSDSIPAFITIIATIFCGGLANGISAGIIFYTAIKLLSGKSKELHWGSYIFTLALIGYFYSTIAK